MKNSALATLATVVLCASLQAQDAPFHTNLRDNIDQGGSSYSDVWGDGTIGYVGRYGQNNVDIIDVNNPDNIVLRSTHTVASPNTGASAHDVKTGTVPVDRSVPLLFVTLESNASDGVEILDVTNPSSPQHLSWVDVTDTINYASLHNTSYREDGWLVLCDSGNPSVAIVDLRSYDPNNPPGRISGFPAYEITNLGFFVHDITITDNYLFISAWTEFIVYDVSDLANSAPSFLGSVQGLSSHAVWPTDDDRYVILTEERTGGAARLYEVIDQGSSVELAPRDSWVNPASGTGSTLGVHNSVLEDDRVYISNYQAGALALQLDLTTQTWEKVASYDTSTFAPSGFNGAWGVYPGLGHENVLISDIEEGFFTVDFSALEITHPSTRPLLIAPSTTETVSVDVRVLGNEGISAVELFASVDNGPFNPIAMANVGGDTYTADLPLLDCGGRVEWYVSADGTSGDTYTSPADAPTSVFESYAGTGLTTFFSDDFQTDQGWTVSGSASDGAWERADPQETRIQPGRGDPDTAGNHCYITGRLGGSDYSTDDLDGGPTRLLSPTLDFSSGDGLISYKRWQFNNHSDLNDGLQVHVSGTGGSPWTLVEDVVLKAGGWIENTFRVSDYVTPSANVVVRFSISDNPNDSTTEGGVDTFRASTIDCTAGPAASATQRNGSGTNSLCYSSLTLPVLGTSWDVEIDHSSQPNTLSSLVVIKGTATSGQFFMGGEILVGSPKFLKASQASAGTEDVYNFPIPNDIGLAGVFAATQGLSFDNLGNILFCNAVDIVVGF